MHFERQFGEYLHKIETSLPDYLPGGECLQKSVNDAMAYSLLSGGKRIRAVLTLAFYNLFRPEVSPVLPYAAAVEMLHAYSLIHDDLPCMDDDDMRRGRPACHIAFGEATALLAGDGLLTLAFETMSDPAHTGFFPAEAVLRAIRCLSSAAGTGGMIGGQVIDLMHEGRQISPEVLEEMDRKKTGALIRAAAQIGCILGGADGEAQAAAAEYAGKLGLAFQVVDDILDCTADEAELGKPTGSDKENKKSTYVGLYGLEGSRRMAEELTAGAKLALQGLPQDTSFLAELAVSLSMRKK